MESSRRPVFWYPACEGLGSLVEGGRAVLPLSGRFCRRRAAALLTLILAAGRRDRCLVGLSRR